MVDPPHSVVLPEIDPHGNSVSVLYYVERLLAERDRALDAAHASMDKRLDSMNEFRDTLRDQAGSFVARQEHDVLARQVEECRRSQAMQEGKASQNSVLIAYVISAIGLAIAIVDMFKK